MAIFDKYRGMSFNQLYMEAETIVSNFHRNKGFIRDELARLTELQKLMDLAR